MQEEVAEKTFNLMISTTKLTAQIVKAAMEKYLDSLDKAMKEKMNAKPTGKQTVKQLIGQNQGVSNIEITESNIKSFDRVARKYGVDYAVKKDKTGEIPKYLIFFKARDADALTAAFKEYTGRKEKNLAKPSVIAKLRSFTPLTKGINKVKVRSKDKGLEL